MSLHAFNQRILAEDLVRVRRPDERERYAAAQRQARIDPNPHQIDAVIFALRRLREGGCILADEVGLGKTIEAGLVVPGAPWQIPAVAVESSEVLQAARDIKNRHRPSRSQFRDECTLELTGFEPFEEEGESQERIRRSKTCEGFPRGHSVRELEI